MTNWKIRGVKFACIVGAGAATGLSIALVAWLGASVGSYLVGWLAGATTCSVAAAALIWQPK